jgi:hypothetical protein
VERLRGRLAPVLSSPADVARVAGFLAELCGEGPDEDDADEHLRAARADPHLMMDSLRLAWDDWVCAEARQRPIALVLEDVHWADASTLGLVDRALAAAAELPLVVVGTARPEVHAAFPALFADRALQEIRLAPLTRRAAQELIKSVLPDVDDQRLADIVARADGHPFVIEELLRAKDGGALPDGVLGIVQLRLEALSPEARRALRAGSIFGEVFWAGGGEAILGVDRLPRSVADELIHGEVIEEVRTSRVKGEPELRFRHALIRDAAYAMLTDEDRRLGHRLAAQWIEKQGCFEAGVIAEHARLGGDLDTAARHWTRARRSRAATSTAPSRSPARRATPRATNASAARSTCSAPTRCSGPTITRAPPRSRRAPPSASRWAATGGTRR